MKQKFRDITIFPNFNFIQTHIASPNQIKDWSERFFYEDNSFLGEVKTFTTEHYKENFMKENGLFCQEIFGPIIDFTCRCLDFKNDPDEPTELIYCPKCKVELTTSNIRTTTLGYLNLILPVVNPFLYTNDFNYLKILLNLKLPSMSFNALHNSIYYTDLINEYLLNQLRSLEDEYVDKKKRLELIEEEVLTDIIKNDSDKTQINENQNEQKIVETQNYYEIEILNSVLETISINQEIKKIRNYNTKRIKSLNLLQLRILESFEVSLTRPEWIILKILPIIGPGFRPFKSLQKKPELSFNLNQLYLQISDLNWLLSWWGETKTNFDGIQLAQKFQILIDNLFVYENANLEEQDIDVNTHKRRGLTDMLEGKEGHFRHYILGKRIDYSGRSVIISGPNLKINQCALPYSIASNLFEPFLLKNLRNHNNFHKDHKSDIFFKVLIDKKKLIILPLLKKIISKETIILNRAPTLHKGSIQSFHPILTLNLAIYLHPMVCAAFNADFDGDQVSINISLLKSSKIEQFTMTKPITNLINTTNANRIIKPNQEIILGCFYSTLMVNQKIRKNLIYFSNFENAVSSFFEKSILLHEPILVSLTTNNNISFSLKNEMLKLLLEKKLIIKKFYFSKSKLYLLTNSGFLIGNKINSKNYRLMNFIIKTTIGQIFYKNLFIN